VRIRAAQTGDSPAITNLGTPQAPRYRVVGILTSGEQLRLPGGSFGRGDTKRLKDYFDRLSADGDERLTAPQTHFGLTDKELSAVLADLSQPIDFETKGQPPRAVIDRWQAKCKQQFAVDTAVEQMLSNTKPQVDELKGVSAGTGLAIMLRSYGLALAPEKKRGQPIVYRVTAGGIDGPLADRPGTIKDAGRKTWPIGWETEKAPGYVAPSLFEKINAEIDGFTLTESLAAIAPRLKMPLYLDHAKLAALKINPGAVKIKVERSQVSYYRLLERVLAQAQLGFRLRADEAGNLFLWVSQ
jgi:hypothetical protein